MEHNINKLKEIREAYAEDMGYKSFANMASSVNIVPRDISEIAKSYAEAVNTELQAKCDRYEAALKWYADEGNYFGDNGELATAWKNKMPLKANEALSSREGNKEVPPVHIVSIGGWITYCPDCGFPVDECNCVDKDDQP